MDRRRADRRTDRGPRVPTGPVPRADGYGAEEVSGDPGRSREGWGTISPRGDRRLHMGGPHRPRVPVQSLTSGISRRQSSRRARSTLQTSSNPDPLPPAETEPARRSIRADPEALATNRTQKSNHAGGTVDRVAASTASVTVGTRSTPPSTWDGKCDGRRPVHTGHRDHPRGGCELHPTSRRGSGRGRATVGHAGGGRSRGDAGSARGGALEGGGAAAMSWALEWVRLLMGCGGLIVSPSSQPAPPRPSRTATGRPSVTDRSRPPRWPPASTHACRNWKPAPTKDPRSHSMSRVLAAALAAPRPAAVTQRRRRPPVTAVAYHLHGKPVAFGLTGEVRLFDAGDTGRGR